MTAAPPATQSENEAERAFSTRSEPPQTAPAEYDVPVDPMDLLQCDSCQ